MLSVPSHIFSLYLSLLHVLSHSCFPLCTCASRKECAVPQRKIFCGKSVLLAAVELQWLPRAGGHQSSRAQQVEDCKPEPAACHTLAGV